MSSLLGDSIHFRAEALFQGAVDISWFNTSPTLSQQAAQAFVFHGPRYHGVNKRYEQSLTDTASFCLQTIKRVYSDNDDCFVLAIAGYGTGKSHLALTLAELLHNPTSPTAQSVIDSVRLADKEIGEECALLAIQPSLVVTINGMHQCNLVAEVTNQIIHVLRSDGYDTSVIENVCPRFAKAASYLEKLNATCIDRACKATGKASLAEVLYALREERDETVYNAVATTLFEEGIPVDVQRAESLADVFEVTLENYCGEGKHYRNIVLLFDEFGKYIEFASERPYIAGSSALQDLFESVQKNKNDVIFTGFIQFDLKAYLQRISPLNKNEAQRYITRFDIASKVLLSSNLETLIANLIEKKDEAVLKAAYARQQRRYSYEQLHYFVQRYFTLTKNSATWSNLDIFTRILCQGCWPLSPFALWFLCALASGSRFLQGRSALSLLKSLFEQVEHEDLAELPDMGLAATRLLTPELSAELVSAEEAGNQGSTILNLLAILNKHQERLHSSQVTVLKAIAIAAKLTLVADNKDDFLLGLSLLSGLEQRLVSEAIDFLQNELNVIEWDEKLHCFDILSDGVPRMQFLAMVRKRRDSLYDPQRRAKLFVSSIDALSDRLGDIATDFGLRHMIHTCEWSFTAKKTYFDNIMLAIQDEMQTWQERIHFDQAKGTVLYCYVESNVQPQDLLQNLSSKMKSLLSKEKQSSSPPLFIILIHDQDGQIGALLAEYDILKNLSPQEQDLYKNLVATHEAKLKSQTELVLREAIKQRHWLCPLKTLPTRLAETGQAIFEQLYPTPLPFTLDGFGTKNGNGPTTAFTFAARLFLGTFTYNDILSMKSQEKNRAKQLNDWGLFNKNGILVSFPTHLPPVFIQLFKEWDTIVQDKGLSLSLVFRQLTLPPYGATVSAALLLIAVYICARSERLFVRLGEELSSIQEWAKQLFDKNKRKLSLSFFHSAILLSNEQASGEWEQLFSEWEEASLYSELATFPKRAFLLRRNLLPTPQEEVRLQYLNERSVEAQQTLENYNALLVKADGQEDVALKKEKLSMLIASANTLKKALDLVEATSEHWPNNIIQELQSRYGKMRQHILQALPEWIAAQAPLSDQAEHIADFKSKLSDSIGKLKSIDLQEEAKLLSEQMSKACRNAEILSSYRQTITAINTWLPQSQATLKDPTIATLTARLQESKDYTAKLEKIAKNHPFEGLAQLRSALKQLHNDLTQAIQAWRSRLGEIGSYPLTSLQEVDEALTQIRTLEKVFQHTFDIQDILDSKELLTWLASQWKRLRDDLLLDNDSVHNALQDIETELTQRIEDAELFFDATTICQAMTQEISELRQSKSKQWFEALQKQCASLDALSIAEATSLLDRCQKTPAYLSQTDRAALQPLIQAINDHLATQRIDWLLHQFKSLSQQEQRLYIKRLLAMVKDS